MAYVRRSTQRRRIKANNPAPIARPVEPDSVTLGRVELVTVVPGKNAKRGPQVLAHNTRIPGINGKFEPKRQRLARWYKGDAIQTEINLGDYMGVDLPKQGE